jgi:hypothetical protein
MEKQFLFPTTTENSMINVMGISFYKESEKGIE